MESNAELSGLVRRHQMRWHVRGEQAVVDGRLMPIGFAVELTATHHAPAHPPTAGCEECVPVRNALVRVANAALPKGEHASWYDVDVAEGSLEYDPSHRSPPRLVATITGLDKGDVNRLPDDCERECLAEIRGHLIELGALED